MAMILLVVAATFTAVFGLTPLLYIGPVTFLAGTLGVRWYTATDISYLYAKLFNVSRRSPQKLPRASM